LQNTYQVSVQATTTFERYTLTVNNTGATAFPIHVYITNPTTGAVVVNSYTNSYNYTQWTSSLLIQELQVTLGWYRIIATQSNINGSVVNTTITGRSFTFDVLD
jgi:hypothetical protein